MTEDTTPTPPEAADIAAIEARLARAYPSFNLSEGVVQMQSDIRALLTVLARATRLVECEWQDDVPLARLHTLREALGIPTDCPVDREMWEADIARNRALLAATLAYGAAQQEEEVAKQASFAANHRGQAWFARCVAGEQREKAARALHAAYVVYAGRGGAQGQEG